MIDLDRIATRNLELEPFEWAPVSGLFAPEDAADLASTYPCDHCKTVNGYDNEKGYVYDVRSLIHMGAGRATHPESLSPAWRALATDLLSAEYRSAVGRLSGRDLTGFPLEVNLFHYGQGAWMGPHVDLKAKVVTHVLYFNDRWEEADGGFLTILRSADAADEAARVLPLVGNSVLLVRSERSWHAVAKVRKGCRTSRRAMTVTFYEPGSPSTMWPEGEAAPLHTVRGDRGRGVLARLLGRA